jgi:beta-lactamase class A
MFMGRIEAPSVFPYLFVSPSSILIPSPSRPNMPLFRLLAFISAIAAIAIDPSPAQGIDAQLQRQLETLCRDFRGTAGVYVHHIPTRTTAAVNADSLFPTASMIKVPILCATFDKLDRGELKYNQNLLYRDTLKYDDGISGSWRDSTKKPLAEIVTLMICFSDNTASLWLQALAGTGTRVNAWLEANGFHSTRVNSRTPGREDLRNVFGWGVTSPKEMAGLIAQIAGGQAVSSAASEEMQRVLGTIHWTREALSQIPPSVKTLSKQGAVDRSKSEVVYVYAPSGAYVFCVITKNQEDVRWESGNEGYALIRTVSALLWKTFEPSHPWIPQCEPVKWEK